MESHTALIEDFAQRIRAATAARTPLCIRGGGSKDFYGNPPNGELLDTRPLSGITAYEPSELYVTARAGTPLAELEAVLAEKGQCFPFEPPHYQINSNKTPKDAGTLAETLKIATVGGMVGAGLSGPARATAGSVRDYLLGAALINGQGQQLQFGGTVMKNVAGYDVSRLFAGSMGTLGLVTEVSLKVLPFAPAEATLRFELDEATALRKLNEWGGQPLPLNASGWALDAGVPTLYLRLRGAVAAVDAACKRLLQEQGGQRVDSPQTTADWAAARDLQLPWFQDGFAAGQDLWRLSVAQSAGPLNVGDTMIDWLGGQRWVWADAGDAHEAARLRSAAQAAGGHATLFVAAEGLNTMAPAVFTPLTPVLNQIQQRLQAEFDPSGIFNPGRMA